MTEVTDPNLSFGAVLTIVGGVVGFMGGIIGMLASMAAKSAGNVYRIGIETAKEQADKALAKNAELLLLHASDTREIIERIHKLENEGAGRSERDRRTAEDIEHMKTTNVSREFLEQILINQTNDVVDRVASRFRETARTISDRGMPATPDPRRDQVVSQPGPMRPRLPSRGSGT